MSTPSTTVTVALGDRAYPIRIGSGLLAGLGTDLAAAGPGRRVLVVTNPVIGRRFGHLVTASLQAAGFDSATVNLSAGERFKHLGSVERIWAAAMDHKLDRGSAIVALGGGVVGDMAGFAAASFYRGIRLVQLPTTLVAMVDSSVGGKTGVNFQGKNLVGAFWQPSLVLADLDTLRTLPSRELRCGMAEVIKHGAILDLALFERLERELVSAPSAGTYALTANVGLDDDLARHCVVRSCELKGQVVAADERELGQRAWLNFGHTYGHALEAVCGYGKLHHGEAVSIGMVLAARTGQRRGELSEADVARLDALCQATGLPTRWPAGADVNAVYAAMHKDKKVLDGRIKLTLLRRLGEAVVTDDTPPDMIRGVLEEAAAEAEDGVG